MKIKFFEGNISLLLVTLYQEVVMRLHLLALVALCLIVPTLYAQTSQEQVISVKEAQALLDNNTEKQKKYLLGPGDVIEVRVFGEPDFSGPVTVDEAGEISIPFVEKTIKAQCRTELDVRADITLAVAKFVKNPRVSVRVTDYRSRPPAVVFGAVRAPQRVQMLRTARLLELLAGAGGVTEQAGETIQVFHTEPVLCPDPTQNGKIAEVNQTADSFKLPFEVYKIADLKAGNADANPEIRPGDIIIVQESAPIYITGAVVMPQPVLMRDKLSLTRAIAIVGGLRKDAKNTVRIYRQKEGSPDPEVLIADISLIKKNKQSDILLKPYDVVDVSEQSSFSPQNLVRTLVGAGTSTITSFGNVLPYRVIQ
jgi:polysaccharide biosynthesis/export protein